MSDNSSPTNPDEQNTLSSGSDSSASGSPASASPISGGKFKIGSQRPNAPKKEKAKAQFKAKPSPNPVPVKTTPVPSIRERSADVEEEVLAAMGDLAFEELLDSGMGAAPVTLEPDSKVKARVARVHREDVFLDLGGRNQGVIPLAQFPKPPAEGNTFEVVIRNFLPDEGLYQATLPGGAEHVGDWSTVSEGMIVEARITGHNKGGLECEVNQLRGFIPAGQIAPYRVENFENFVGERWNCVITEANPEKRNLVLSRRAVLEREREQAKAELLAQMAEGNVLEGTVRSLQDYGAFVDLGGVEGLLHVSQLSWKRVRHPSEVLQVGQKIKVKIRKIDPDNGKISLSFRDLMENPWDTASNKYPVTSTVQGVVTRVADFGAFVELEPGIEGLVHVSELAHGRVWKVSALLKEGDSVEAKVLSVDPEQQRMSLSIKALQAKPDTAKKEEEPEEEAIVEEPVAPKPVRKTPLKGGLGGSGDGGKFGLKW